MYLTAINPCGGAISLDLLHLPIWKMELGIIGTPGSESKALALGIRYVANGITAFAAFLALDCKCEEADLLPVVRLGLPYFERTAAKERLRESLKVLYNASVSGKDVEEIVSKSAQVVDAYFDVKQALWGLNPSLSAVGPLAKGESFGWVWAFTRERFCGWIPDAAQQSEGMGDPPGQEPETVVLDPAPAIQPVAGKKWPKR